MRGEVRELEEDTVEAWRDSEPMEAAASSKAALAWAACCRASVSTYMAACAVAQCHHHIHIVITDSNITSMCRTTARARLEDTGCWPVRASEARLRRKW